MCLLKLQVKRKVCAFYEVNWIKTFFLCANFFFNNCFPKLIFSSKSCFSKKIFSKTCFSKIKFSSKTYAMPNFQFKTLRVVKLLFHNLTRCKKVHFKPDTLWKFCFKVWQDLKFYDSESHFQKTFCILWEKLLTVTKNFLYYKNNISKDTKIVS